MPSATGKPRLWDGDTDLRPVFGLQGGQRIPSQPSFCSVNISKLRTRFCLLLHVSGDPEQVTHWQDFDALRSAWLWGHAYRSHTRGVCPQPHEAGGIVWLEMKVLTPEQEEGDRGGTAGLSTGSPGFQARALPRCPGRTTALAWL